MRKPRLIKYDALVESLGDASDLCHDDDRAVTEFRAFYETAHLHTTRVTDPMVMRKLCRSARPSQTARESSAPIVLVALLSSLAISLEVNQPSGTSSGTIGVAKAAAHAAALSASAVIFFFTVRLPPARAG